MASRTDMQDRERCITLADVKAHTVLGFEPFNNIEHEARTNTALLVTAEELPSYGEAQLQGGERAFLRLSTRCFLFD